MPFRPDPGVAFEGADAQADHRPPLGVTAVEVASAAFAERLRQTALGLGGAHELSSLNDCEVLDSDPGAERGGRAAAVLAVFAVAEPRSLERCPHLEADGAAEAAPAQRGI